MKETRLMIRLFEHAITRLCRMLERENMLGKSGLEQATLSLFPTTN